MKTSEVGRNALEWSVGNSIWVMTTDNSGAIGEKPADHVQVPYHIVAYFSFRSAVLDCLSAGALPATVILHNFCGDHVWDKLVEGVKQGLEELGLQDVVVTGSTESNMSLNQSAVAITIIGERKRHFVLPSQGTIEWDLIGEPLVGMDVIKKSDRIAPLSKAIELFWDEKTIVFWPIGSKGIRQEWSNLSDRFNWSETLPPFNEDLDASAGPSTCWILGRQPDQ